MTKQLDEQVAKQINEVEFLGSSSTLTYLGRVCLPFNIGPIAF